MRQQELLAEIVRRVDTTHIASQMVDVFRAEIRAYGRLPETAVNGQVLDISKQNVDLFFTNLIEGGPIEEEDLKPFRLSARNRAGEGMPLEELLHAYRLGGRLGWQALVEEATPEEQTALLPSAARLMEHIDRVSDAVTESYHEWSRHLASEEERRVRELFDALTTDAPLEPEMLASAEAQGVPVVDEYAVFVLAVPGSAGHVHAQHAAALRRQGAVAVTEGDRIVGLLGKGESEPALGPEPHGLYAVADPAPRGELRTVLADLRSLVDIGLRLGSSGRMEVEDHLPELLLARSPGVGERVRRRALGPLEDYAARRRANLLETLETFIDCDLDRRDAAERLRVHPNTLDYRLRRVEDLTGMKLGRTGDMVLVWLALKQRTAAT
jgi:hypothetical protein